MKRRFFTAVVAHRKFVLALFAVLAVACGICRQYVQVDYDMNDYLPAETPSTRALGVMEEQFVGGIPNARILVRDVSYREANEVKARIEAVQGVTCNLWLDDILPAGMPPEALGDALVETYYKDENALFSITIDADARIEAVDAIRKIIGDGNAMTGSAVNTAAATTSTVSEIRVITVLTVVFVLLVLLLLTTSWVEPFILLAGLGVAVVVNAGTNIVFGTISFVTNAAGMILQIGISLDFAVFMLHRYGETRGRCGSVEAAMVEALCQVSTAVTSSALTVMFGFLALTVMQFRIGPDLGLALAKGIVVSLVTVLTFVPALLLAFHGAVERTRHRAFVSVSQRTGEAIAKAAVPLALVFALVPIPSLVVSMQGDANYWYGASHIFSDDSWVGADRLAVAEVFGTRDTYALLVPRDDVVAQRELSQKLHDIPQVKSVLSTVDILGPMMPEDALPARARNMLASDEYSRMVVTVEADFEGDQTFSLVEEVRAAAESCFPGEYLLAGGGVSTTDLMQTVTADKLLVDMLAVAAVFLVIAIAFRSLLLPVVLVLAIESSIWINYAIPVITGANVFYIAYLIESAVQLGATVDYAILLADRYLEVRAELPRREAVVATVRSVAVPILTSGIVLCGCGFAMGAVSSHGVLAQLGFFLGRGVLLSLVIVLLVVPGVFYLLDAPIRKTTWRRRAKGPREESQVGVPGADALL